MLYVRLVALLGATGKILKRVIRDDINEQLSKPKAKHRARL